MHPMAGIAAGADALAVTFGYLEDGIRVPIRRRFGVVVNGYINLVFLAQLVDGIKIAELWLRNQRFNSHLLGEIKGLLVIGTDTHVYQGDTLIGEVSLDLFAITI